MLSLRTTAGMIIDLAFIAGFAGAYSGTVVFQAKLASWQAKATIVNQAAALPIGAATQCSGPACEV